MLYKCFDIVQEETVRTSLYLHLINCFVSLQNQFAISRSHHSYHVSFSFFTKYCTHAFVAVRLYTYKVSTFVLKFCLCKKGHCYLLHCACILDNT